MAKFTLPAAALLALAQASHAAAPDAMIRQQASRLIAQRLSEAGLDQAAAQLQLLPPRSLPDCASPWEIQAADVRAFSRMRFEANCPASGWRGAFIVRAAVSARVAVAARELRAGETLRPEDVDWAERPIAEPAELFGRAAPPLGQQLRSALAAGQPLRRRQLQAPLLVKRGGAVRIVARQDGIEVTVSGEAQSDGRQGEIIRVRNLDSGKTIAARVSAPDEVEPRD
ncbi:flagellar basal body P-ring formation chaperone FlgA [Chromobacterium alticapitis]|uniref:Flagella basal body P-ring formation protein FlgA n=1 Tax=Chromobacterium alticapitis TaxID=2073169 RepID=A0A2S5DF29_9NEIS|nr:flagellar basal body P-ring formation chaperone FlgA [Chromobacterium alticapitis]POZ61639.1 flagella basal body P-ring formation protein FlgA [Chromobacterium alticapitis]